MLGYGRFKTGQQLTDWDIATVHITVEGIDDVMFVVEDDCTQVKLDELETSMISEYNHGTLYTTEETVLSAFIDSTNL